MAVGASGQQGRTPVGPKPERDAWRVGVELRPAEGGTGRAEGAHGVGPSAARAGLGPVSLLWDVISAITRLPHAHDGATVPAHVQKPPPALRSPSLPEPC